MKKLIISIMVLLTALSGYGQIQYLRYNDDFSFLKGDSISKKGFQKLKFIPLSATVPTAS